MSLGRALRYWTHVSLDLLALCILYIGFLFVRGLIAHTVDVREALERGRALADLETQLHLSVERPFQKLAMRIPLAISAMNLFYIWGHVPLMLGEFAWLRVRSLQWFTVLRNGLLLSAIPSVILFIIVPTAPPRLVPGLGLVDTVAGPNHSNYGLQPGVFANHYAAIPSMHVGWALAVGLALCLAMGSTRWRWLVLVVPVAMALSVMGTGNHYVLDWVIGCAIAVASLAAAWRWEEWWQGRKRPVELEVAAGRLEAAPSAVERWPARQLLLDRTVGSLTRLARRRE